jgi:hypothetical protein
MATTGAYHVQYSTTLSNANGYTFNASRGYLKFETIEDIEDTPITGTVENLYRSNFSLTTDLTTNVPGYSLTNCGSLGTDRQLEDYVTFATVSAAPLAAFALTQPMLLNSNFLSSTGAGTAVSAYRINVDRSISYSLDGTNFIASGSTISYNTIAGAADNLANTGDNVFNGDGTVNNCFLEGTKLYAHVHDKDLYVNIEDLRSGDIVNTYLHGKKAIKFIGKDTLFNNPDKWNGCLKKFPKSGNMIDDLYITGAHSLLVDEVSEKESNGIMAIYGTTDRKIDDKFMLNAWVSEKAEPVLTAEFFTIYHLVLEHDDDEDKKYGIWANGVLAESQCEKHFLKGTHKLL